MSELAKRVVVVLVALSCASCADSEVPPTYMGNTNWLVSCDGDDDCSDGLSCGCGVCTKTCETSSDCASLNAACDTGSDALVSACGSSPADGICLPECEEDDDCGRGQCIDAHCLPAQMSTSGDGDGDGIQDPIGCGPNGAFTSAALAPDEECLVSPDNRRIPRGQHDVSPGFNGEEGSCDKPYVAWMLLYSCMQGADDTLQIHSAEVRLTDSASQTIVFDRFVDPLPNPFLVVSNATIFPMREDGPSPGVASVELIPTAYAEQLDGFVDQQLLAEITLFGGTVGGVEVELKPFRFPIDICLGCLTYCIADLPADLSIDDVYGEGVCRDDAGADGRVCLDTSCTN